MRILGRFLSLCVITPLCLRAAGVDFVSYDVDGNSRVPVVLEFTNRADRVNYVSAFRGGSARGLPAGTYTYRARSGRREIDGVTVLREGIRLIVLPHEPRLTDPVSGREVHVDYGPRDELDGRILGIKKGGTEGLWIRVLSAVNPADYDDAYVAADGSFMLHSSPRGRCVIIIFSRGQPVHVQARTLPNDRAFKVEITLPK